MLHDKSPSLQIRCFGPFRAEINGLLLPSLHSKKERLLLAYMTLRYDREVERNEVAGALWPDSLEEQARFNLRQTLSSLRKALGPAAVRLESPSKQALRLHISAEEADIVACDLAARRMDDASLETLASLYSSPLLEGWGEKEGEGWILPEREARQQQGVKAIRELCRRALARCDYSGAKRSLHQLAAGKIVDEALWRELIQAFLDAREYTLAMRTFEELEAQLNAIDRTLPAPETLALHQSIPESERKRQLWQPALPVVPSLPMPLNRFFGREAEREALWQQITEENLRLITLTGPGGAGKTRLSLETGRQLAERFANNLWFVPLADVRDAQGIAEALLKAFGKKRDTHSEPFEQACAFLNNKKAPVLLILDNFEQIVQEGASRVRALLRNVPRLTCLITSRRRLGIPDEYSLPLSLLPVPEEIQPIHELYRNPCVQLFVDRARKPRPSFQMNEENGQAIADLCRRLEGLPLALELAATRASMLTPAQMLAELKRRMLALSRLAPSQNARHDSLQAALQWSYDLLPPDLQPLFAGISVFSGGWTLEAAQSVCLHSATLDGLDRLHTCSLLLLDEKNDAMRWQMLGSVREFAQEQLTPEQRSLCQRRHARHFLALARKAQRALRGAEQEKWLARLEADQENLRTALQWTLENDTDMALRFSSALARYWEVRGCLSEDREFVKNALNCPVTPFRKKSRMGALITMANLAWHHGDAAMTYAYRVECLRLAREIGEPRNIGRALNGLGIQAMDMGQYEESQCHFEESLALYRKIHEIQGVGNALFNLGCLLDLMKEDAASAACYAESLAVRRSLTDEFSLSQSLSGSGLAACRAGDYALGRRYIEEALGIERRLGKKRGIANSLHHLGLIAQGEGKDAEAWDNYEQSLRLRLEADDKLGIAESLEKYASRAMQRQNYLRAVQLLASAQTLHQATGLVVFYYDRVEYEEITCSLKEAVSKAEFRQAWKKGAEMTAKQAVEFALEPD